MYLTPAKLGLSIPTALACHNNHFTLTFVNSKGSIIRAWTLHMHRRQIPTWLIGQSHTSHWLSFTRCTDLYNSNKELSEDKVWLGQSCTSHWLFFTKFTNLYDTNKELSEDKAIIIKFEDSLSLKQCMLFKAIKGRSESVDVTGLAKAVKNWSGSNCERIWEKGPLGTNFHLEIWSKISNQPQSGLFPDYCSSTNYYPLPTFWHKSDARACCCSSMRSVYFHPLDPPFIAWTGGVVTWSQCYRGNGGSSTSVKDRFSAWAHSQMKLKTAFDAGPSC